MRLAKIIPLLIIISFVSCSRKVYLPVETVRTEYVDRVQLETRIDSIFQRDSISVYIQGDTVRIEKWRDRIKYRDREVHDTIAVVKVDSIAVPYPVEKELSKWQKAKMNLGGMAMGILAIVLCIAVIWLIKKYRK